MIRELQASEVTFTLSIEAEETPVRGNALASGDDAADKECEDDIIARLESGNDWAWCTVKVTASWGDFEGVDYLGCCSYESEDDFKSLGGYYESMCDEALARLNEKIAATGAKIAELVT